ncbi:MAG: hypothetical protein EBS01_05075 [Verrucomicrobia bacterium]|nr:hypothetical protein [Verrucomicrobiota bacterium]
MPTAVSVRWPAFTPGSIWTNRLRWIRDVFLQCPDVAASKNGLRIARLDASAVCGFYAETAQN